MIPAAVVVVTAGLAALGRWADRSCKAMVTRALSDPAIKARAAAILAAQQCPDEIEPPEYVEPEPIYQEIVTETVLDAANTRLRDHGWVDGDAWEDERCGVKGESS